MWPSQANFVFLVVIRKSSTSVFSIHDNCLFPSVILRGKVSEPHVRADMLYTLIVRLSLQEKYEIAVRNGTTFTRIAPSHSNSLSDFLFGVGFAWIVCVFFYYLFYLFLIHDLYSLSWQVIIKHFVVSLLIKLRPPDSLSENLLSFFYSLPQNLRLSFTTLYCIHYLSWFPFYPTRGFLNISSKEAMRMLKYCHAA